VGPAFGSELGDNSVHVFFGGDDDLEGTVRPDDGKLTITGDPLVSAGSVGDLDGDGLSEMLISTYETTAAGDYDFVLVSGRTDWPAEVSWEDGDVLIATGKSEFHAPLAVGDLNGDGRGDLLLPDPGPGTVTDVGAIDVWLGRTDWPTTLTPEDVDVRFEGNSAGQALGYGILVMDLDGDDFDDLLAPTPSTGTTYIFFGKP
jgi:hypothetical protein